MRFSLIAQYTLAIVEIFVCIIQKHDVEGLCKIHSYDFNNESWIFTVNDTEYYHTCGIDGSQEYIKCFNSFYYWALQGVLHSSASVTQIIMDHCNLQVIQEGFFFSNDSQLRLILLSECNISKIANNAFSGGHNLEYLQIFKNNITALVNTSLKGLDNLKGFRMRHSLLQIQNGTFVHTPALLYLAE